MESSLTRREALSEDCLILCDLRGLFLFHSYIGVY
jgi:hypothetical protein